MRSEMNDPSDVWFVMALRIKCASIESGLNVSPFSAQLLLLHAQNSSKMKIETFCSMLSQFFEAQNWTLLLVEHKYETLKSQLLASQSVSLMLIVNKM